jgi:hypothetical protein
MVWPAEQAAEMAPVSLTRPVQPAHVGLVWPRKATADRAACYEGLLDDYSRHPAALLKRATPSEPCADRG